MRRSGAIAAARRRSSATFARPTSTPYSAGVSAVGAPTIHGAINEVSVNDATYASFNEAPRELQVGLSSVPTPAAGLPHTIVVRVGNTSGNYFVQLLDGPNDILTNRSRAGTTALETATFTLTSAEVASIVSYSNLQLAVFPATDGARLTHAYLQIGT